MILGRSIGGRRLAVTGWLPAFRSLGPVPLRRLGDVGGRVWLLEAVLPELLQDLVEIAAFRLSCRCGPVVDALQLQPRQALFLRQPTGQKQSRQSAAGGRGPGVPAALAFAPDLLALDVEFIQSSGPLVG